MKRWTDCIGRDEDVRLPVVHLHEAIALTSHRQPAYEHRCRRDGFCESFLCPSTSAARRFWLFTNFLWALSTRKCAEPEPRHLAYQIVIREQQELPDHFVLRGPGDLESPTQLSDVHRTWGMCLQDAQDFVSFRYLFCHCALPQGVNPAIIRSDVECSVRRDLHRGVDVLADVVPPENGAVGIDAIEKIVL